MTDTLNRDISDDREKAIIRSSVIGIVVNLLMAAFKALIGLVSNSIVIILDAVNNLSDAMSSVVTIVGAKLGALAPNKKHPFGYGRIEYISSMLVSAIVIYAGLTSVVESIKKIIHPEEAEYSAITIGLLLIAVVVKIILGRFIKSQGKKYGSIALVASGTEAMMDAVLSITVVVSALIYMKWNISLEAYVGVVIAIIIIKAGVEMMLSTLDDILGKRSDREEVNKIKQTICEEPDVRGAYDLYIYNYGPNKDYASVHIEVPDTMTSKEFDRLSRRIQERVYRECKVTLTAIGVYAHNTSSDEISKMREDINQIVERYNGALQMHGLYVDVEQKLIRFDVVISFDVDKNKAICELTEAVSELYPDYQIIIVPDIDV